MSSIKDMLLELQKSILNIGSLNTSGQSTLEKMDTIQSGTVATDVSEFDDNLSYTINEEEASVEVEENATDSMLELLGSI